MNFTAKILIAIKNVGGDVKRENSKAISVNLSRMPGCLQTLIQHFSNTNMTIGFICYNPLTINDKVISMCFRVETAHLMHVKCRVPTPSSMFLKSLLCTGY